MDAEGVINLCKPTGVSSAHYVYRLRRIFGLRRVGHAGALDPFADGVLLGCVGKATRLVERLMGLAKVYQVGMRLGVTNETFDPERAFETVADAAAPTVARIEAALRDMQGDVEQIPPVYSAVKLGGRSAHRRARDGETVTLVPRVVRIDRIELLAYEWPALSLRVTCGRGTYIRALARDLGQRWGCGAVCESLRRTGVGPFDIGDAVNLNATPRETVRNSLLTVAMVESILARANNPSVPATPR